MALKISGWVAGSGVADSFFIWYRVQWRDEKSAAEDESKNVTYGLLMS